MLAAPRFGRRIDGEIQLPNGPLGPVHEVLACQGQADALGAAFEDWSAEAVFQFLDPPRDRGLLDAEMTGGAAKAAVLGGGEHVTELMQAKPRAGAGLAEVGDS